jgi:DNA-binding beta-propeller fold protein YncE
VYVTNGFTDDVSQFSVGSRTGRLSSKRPATIHSGAPPAGIALTPDGRNAYVANFNTNFLAQYSVERRSGALVPKADRIVRAGSQPADVAVSPDGRSVYVTVLGAVAQFDVDRMTGELFLKMPPTVPADAPGGLAVSPDGDSLYVGVNEGIAQFDVDPMSGTLTPKNPAVVRIPDVRFPGFSDIAVSPDNRHAYATSQGFADVFQFGIDAGGRLAPASPLRVPAVGLQDEITLLPDAPTARFRGSTGQGTASFDASPSIDPGGWIARYAWAFGDGATKVTSRARVAHRYRRPGRYRVTLSVTSAAGCSPGEFVYTGQTASCNGRHARVTRTVRIG